MNRATFVGAIAIVLLVAFPALSVPQAVAPSHPVFDTQGGVHGHVLSDLGGPLGGAVVVASRSTATGGTSEGSTVWTEPDGSYTLKLSSGTWNLNVTARAHAGRNASVVVVSESIGAERNFTLVHTGPAIKGIVRDAKTGAGIAGVTVEAHQDNNFRCSPGMACPAVMAESYRAPLATRTGADGRYALAVDEKGMVNLRAWRDGYREAWMSIEVQGDTTQDLKLSPMAPKNAVLEGTVTDAKTGRPIANAWVNAYPNYDHRLAAEGSTSDPATGGGSSGSAGSTVVVDCADADGAFRDCAAPPCCQEGNSTQTDSSGRYRMAMYPGTYQFNVGAQEYGQHMEQLTLADNEQRRADVKLQPIPGDSVTVRGIVVDKATGKPVAGAWVSVENQEWGHYNGAQAGEDGRFELKTKPGWTLLWVRVDGGYGYAQPATAGSTEPAQADQPVSSDGNGTAASPAPSGIRAPDSMPRPYIQSEGSYYPWVKGQRFAEDQTVDLRVELQPKPKADVRIQGYVLNATSKTPIAGAYVSVHNEDTGDWGNAQTDKDGSFVLMGRAGTHTINANADGYFQNAAVVAVKGPSTRVDLALEPGQGRGYCCIAYAAGMEKGAAMDSSAPPPVSPASPGTSSGTMQGRATAQASASGAAGSGNQQAATYNALGEGLGPYDASTAPAPGSASTTANAAPGPGLLVALAGLGAAALLVARRKR